MADQSESRAAMRIITDLTAPSAVNKPRDRHSDLVTERAMRTEVAVLVKSDLALAGMLDELDAKINATGASMAEYGQALAPVIEEFRQRLAALEARSLPFWTRVRARVAAVTMTMFPERRG